VIHKSLSLKYEPSSEPALQDTEARLRGEVARVALLIQERARADSAGREKKLAQENLMHELNTEVHALREKEATAHAGIIPKPWNLNPGA